MQVPGLVRWLNSIGMAGLVDTTIGMKMKSTPGVR